MAAKAGIKSPHRLHSAPVIIQFVTNMTKECKRDLLERLTKLGFDIAENEIFTSLTAARNLLEQKQVRPLLLVDDKALPDFTGIATDDPNAVVVGLAPEHFHYEMMNRAFRLLLGLAPVMCILSVVKRAEKGRLNIPPPLQPSRACCASVSFRWELWNPLSFSS
ncbi:PREDICTED: haloacid dehalogenase-like hydrolase domain-containing protein 2, partial [Nipponia nippon]|uniref:haloacid dehalogenase-like hydrolase domain-containing protein 2 n=1 Tax=Nipponia nippon TaxID=128390 RepID=UPI000511AE4A